jgi:hypothetical protein
MKLTYRNKANLGKVRKILAFHSRKCSACTLTSGYRCKNHTCYASNALQYVLPEELKKKIEVKLMKVAHLSNCNLNYSSDCCGLCAGHMRLALIIIMGAAAAKTIFNQLNDTSANDWNAHDTIIKELEESLD